MMQNPKHQNSNTRENPIPKFHVTGDERLPHRDSSFYAWAEEPEETLVLKDEMQPKHPFDLLERTAVFGEQIIRFSKRIPPGPPNNRLIDQVVGAATSIGANYCEAEERVSKKDFKNTVSRCVKEAKETMFFLRMIVASAPELTDEARALYREAKELMLIFASIYRK